MASVYLVRKLEGMNRSTVQGLKMRVCRGRSCEKLVFHNEGGVSQRLKYKKKQSIQK